ncbi:bifunctional metallophosphatase/5'-nucleotidase [Pseudoflavonifractor phocaeensis]|nr:bifunctional metallophosphatase/5'-nucleotidase [Pseudoflavonifractor phocaeensis]
MALVLLCTLLPTAVWAGAPACTTTVLFTHDLHSHFLPQRTEDGGASGGYARLKTALDRERAEHPDALVVDGGDFSVGSLIQTLYTTQAAELRTMGAMGYDAATVGNHEFDHKGTGFAQMLNAAVLSGDRVPALLMANYWPSAEDPNQLDIQRAMAAYGVKDSVLLERGGVTYGIFGLMGEDSHDCAPTSGFVLEDRVKSAQRCVDSLKEQGAQFIICLSHSGTNEKEKKSEDEQLAKKVEGIDLIVSGHTHTTLTEPIVVGDTYIVSAGPYCENLGSITLTWSADGAKSLTDYRLIPIDETVPEDPEISAMVEGWKSQVSGSYLARYGFSYDQVLTTGGFDLETPESGLQEGNALGELVADAFLWASRELVADAPSVHTVAVTADGVLRAPLYAGEITASQTFDVLSMGVGEDGTSGFPLVEVYLTGKELKAAAEVDASVTPIMPVVQLYLSGMSYSFNTHRMFFNRVTEVQLYQDTVGDGNSRDRAYTQIDDDQLYRVVTGMYSAQMLGTVKSKSMGLLSLEPKMADGSPVTDFNDCILYDKNGSEIKEWYALAAYLRSFGENGLPDWYAASDGRKDVNRSWSPIQLLKHPNWITLAALAVLVLVALAVYWAVRTLVRRQRRRRYGGGYRRRRFGR